jgi:hypothetical protein
MLAVPESVNDSAPPEWENTGPTVSCYHSFTEKADVTKTATPIIGTFSVVRKYQSAPQGPTHRAKIVARMALSNVP